jgi:hypothetical protein
MKILRIVMESKSPEILADFYEKVLALPVHRKPGETEILIGNSQIFFTQSTWGQNPFYHFAFNIPANKIEEAKDWLSAKVKLLWMADYNSDVADFRNWHAKSIYFFDEAGNIVELIARFDLKNGREEPFSSAQLLSVSEIGIVYREKEIEKNTNALIQRNELAYFPKQPPFPQFKAVGDDEGLFIIVTEGRNWYPTSDKAAGIFPLQVEFEVQGKRCNETF